MDTLTATTLSEILREPEKVLLGRVIKMLGQERCAAILADVQRIEQDGGMLTKAGDRRRTPGGTFFELVKQRSTGKERYGLFVYGVRRAAPGKRQSLPAQPDASPVLLTLDQWKGLKPMAISATLKLVLHDTPEIRESGDRIYMALTNEPKGLPKGIHLDTTTMYITAPVKQWRTACAKAEQIRATRTPALFLLECHVSTREGALVGVCKSVQVVEGKAPVQTQAG
jgi:hypothetical protein